MEQQQLLKFGGFALKADQSVLELDGRAMQLTPKMFDMLLVLVKNQGRIVEKETFLREVWPDSFVEEGNIAFNIRQLRKLLGDDARAPSYIETVPKRGYRFIAPVDAVTEVQKSAEPRRRYTPILAIGIFLLILIAIVLTTLIT